VIDHFAELGFARAPWLDAEDVKWRHHTLMSEAHPDKALGDADRAARLNMARRVLEQPATRLRHFLELEFPGFKSGEKPQPDWEFFSRIGEAARRAGEIASHRQSASPLARAVADARVPEMRKTLAALQEELDGRTSNLEQKTRSLSASLPEPRTASALVEEWIFVNRWQAVIQKAVDAL